MGDPGVIIDEICCTFEYDVASDVVGAMEGTTDVIEEVCSGYVTLVRGDDDAFWKNETRLQSKVQLKLEIDFCWKTNEYIKTTYFENQLH